MRRLELIGQRFTRLVVIARDEKRDRYWLCRCDCGKTVSVFSSHLKRNLTLSCGCLSADKARARHLTHGETDSPEYNVWCHAKRRCYNPKDSAYARYGGRGITMCDEWRRSFETFLAHVGKRPSAAHSIDRIDNNRGYEPGNVRWATRAVQAANKNRCIYVTFQGERITLAEFARRTGQSYALLLRAASKGHDPLTYKRQRNRG